MAAGQASLEGLQIRPLRSLEEFNLTLGLQKRVWGFDEADVVAPRLFSVFSRIGGSCLGVFRDGKLVGYSLAFPAFKPGGRRYWHSHMAAVHPSVQHQGIGHRLKLRQREDALAAGLDLIEWTFDPLQARNAYFNIEKLGTDVVGYLPNFYGVTSSELHGSLPTDRVVAAWRLNSRQVLERLEGRRPAAVPGDSRIRIPARISEVSRSRASRIQDRVRTQFQEAFARGLRVTHFERSRDSGIYHLAP